MMQKLTVLEARRIGDHWCVRYSNTEPGRYVTYKSPVDAMMSYCARYMGDTMPKTMAARIGIVEQKMGRSRRGILKKFNDAWILWAHEYSGAPIESLRTITGTLSHKM